MASWWEHGSAAGLGRIASVDALGHVVVRHVGGNCEGDAGTRCTPEEDQDWEEAQGSGSKVRKREGAMTATSSHTYSDTQEEGQYLWCRYYCRVCVCVVCVRVCTVCVMDRCVVSAFLLLNRVSRVPHSRGGRGGDVGRGWFRRLVLQ